MTRRCPPPGICVDPASPLELSHPLNLGLVSEWACLPGGQWGQGTKWRDLNRRNANDGTLTNGPTWSGASGRPGGFGALRFDGSNAYTALAASASLNLSSAFSICAWFNASATSGSGIFEKTSNGSVNTQYLMFLESGKLLARIKPAGAGVTITGGTTISTGTWYFGTATYDGTNLSLYLNAKLDATPVSSGNATTGSAIAQIGALVGVYKFSGYIDSVAVYSRALSASEVLALYKESLADNPNRWRWLGRRSYFFPAGNTFAFRKTLSMYGSGTGKRQAQAS